MPGAGTRIEVRQLGTYGVSHPATLLVSATGGG